MAKTGRRKVCAFRMNEDERKRVDAALVKINASPECKSVYGPADFYRAAVACAVDDTMRGGKSGVRLMLEWLEATR
jgi:hypothetical protein